jgi:formate-dependent nitrite reductase membrane component NrfD
MVEGHWGWLIAIYLFLGGMGAGSFLTAAVVELSGHRYRHDFCPTSLIGAGVSGPLLAVGTVLLILDLGAGLQEPWRIIWMFTNFSSVMTWGIWILSIFIPLCFVYGFLELLDNYPGLYGWIRRFIRFLPESFPFRHWRRVLAALGIVLALGTALYTGVLLSVVEAVPLWNTPILPLLFLVSAASTGMGLTIDLGATIALPEVHRRYTSLPAIHMALLVAEAVLIAVVLLIANGKGGVAAESVRVMLTGAGAPIFWGLVVVPGLAFPFVVHAYAIGAHRHGLWSGILSGLGIVIAGLFLRYLIVFASIPVLL